MNELFTYNLDDMWGLPEEVEEVNFSRFAIEIDKGGDPDGDSVWVCEHCDIDALSVYGVNESHFLENLSPRETETIFCEVCGRCSNPHCDCQEHS